MKILRSISVLLFISVSCSHLKNNLSSRNDLPLEWGFARMLTGSMSINAMLEGKSIPTSWDDFIEISWMKSGKSERSSGYIKRVNSFALVPGMPIIQPQQGISEEYVGKKLYAISRHINYTKYATQGKCLILVQLDPTNTNFISAGAYFIPVPVAQLILKQMNGFDPESQPLAFDDNFIYNNRATIKGDALDEAIEEIESSKQPTNPLVNASADRVQKRLQKIEAARDAKTTFARMWPWLLGGSVIASGMALRKYIKYRAVV
jgi:hypothetical protein